MLNDLWDFSWHILQNFEGIWSNFYVRVSYLFTEHIHDPSSKFVLGKLFRIRLNDCLEYQAHVFLSIFPVAGLALLEQALKLLELIRENCYFLLFFLIRFTFVKFLLSFRIFDIIIFYLRLLDGSFKTFKSQLMEVFVRNQLDHLVPSFTT